MKFTLDDTRQRYRSTLQRMEPEKSNRVGDSWDKAALGFYFGVDRDRAHISIRDTLNPMLVEDGRLVEEKTIKELLDSVNLDQLAGDVAAQIHQTYVISEPKQ